MIDQLIEIVFENVPKKELGILLKNLTCDGGEISNYNLTLEYSSKIDWSSESSINEVFEMNNDFGLFINLRILNIDDISLKKCGLATYKNKNMINFELNFQLSDFENDGKFLADILLKLAKYIASKYHIKNFFCGLEPASDKNTRLFTNDQIGPLFLNY